MDFKCLLVDDEPLASSVLQNYLNRIPGFEVVGICDSAGKALQCISAHKPDLIFLDVQMPGISGIDFLRTLRNPPLVIMVTSHRDYAVDGFELNVLDYLIKPVLFERFFQAIGKFYEVYNKRNAEVEMQTALQEPADEAFIYIKENKRTVKISIKEILFIEAVRDYVTIQTIDKKVITKQLISYFESELENHGFLRIHRSYLVAKNKINAFSNNSVEINKKELPIGRSYKMAVLKEIEN